MVSRSSDIRRREYIRHCASITSLRRRGNTGKLIELCRLDAYGVPRAEALNDSLRLTSWS